MTQEPTPASLVYAFPEPPEVADPVEVAPGLLWVRLSLPFRLDHVNIYLIEDGPGWAVIDTGLGDAPTCAAWEQLLAGALAGRPLTRLIVTHCHPDHVGCAGWLSERLGLPVLMSQTEYLISANVHLDPAALEAEHHRRFYREHGLDETTTSSVVTRGHAYLKMVTGLPPTFRRLIAGETLAIGGREFSVLTGGGHSAEQVMLYCAAENLFLAADQVLARISPNVSVWAVDPEGDPLGIYLRSLDGLQREIPADALVLPGHNLPFYGLHRRIDELKRHHAARCDAIAAACRQAPRPVADLVPVLFPRALDPHQMGFAFSETLAHVNSMLRDGRLMWTSEEGTVRRVAAL
jgi:glyoxylase-like metal-dependent hydrolase (beta-lactamase superfamily II)